MARLAYWSWRRLTAKQIPWRIQFSLNCEGYPAGWLSYPGNYKTREVVSAPACGHPPYVISNARLRFRQNRQGVAEAERAHQLDPLNLLTHTVVGDTLFYARRYERSVASYRKCLELDPTFGAATPISRARWRKWGGPTKQSKSSYGGPRAPMACRSPHPASRSSMRGPGGRTMRVPLRKQSKVWLRNSSSRPTASPPTTPLPGTMSARSIGSRRPTPSAMERWCGLRCTRGSMDCGGSRGFEICWRACDLIPEPEQKIFA
jgi:hypothetical protein